MANAATILTLIREAVDARKSEGAERNAVVKVLARYGYRKLPSIEVGSSGGLLIRVFRWKGAVNGRDILLITGPGIEGEVRLEGSEEEEEESWDTAKGGAWVQLDKGSLNAKSKAMMKRMAGRVETLGTIGKVKKVKARKPRKPRPPEPMILRLLVELDKYGTATLKEVGATSSQMEKLRQYKLVVLSPTRSSRGAKRYSITARGREELPEVPVPTIPVAAPDPEVIEKLAQRLAAIVIDDARGDPEDAQRDAASMDDITSSAVLDVSTDYHTWRDMYAGPVVARMREVVAGYGTVDVERMATSAEKALAELEALDPFTLDDDDDDDGGVYENSALIIGTIGEARTWAPKGAPFRAPHYSVSRSGLAGEVHRAVGGVLFIQLSYMYDQEQIEALVAALQNTQGTVRVVIDKETHLRGNDALRYEAFKERLKAHAPTVLNQGPDGYKTLLSDALHHAEEGHTNLAHDMQRAATTLFDTFTDAVRYGPELRDPPVSFNDVSAAISQQQNAKEAQRLDAQIEEHGSFASHNVRMALRRWGDKGSYIVATVPPIDRQRTEKVFVGDPVASLEDGKERLRYWAGQLSSRGAASISRTIQDAAKDKSNEQWEADSRWAKDHMAKWARGLADADVAEVIDVYSPTTTSAEAIDDVKAYSTGKKTAARDLHGKYPTEAETHANATEWYGASGTPLHESFMQGWNDEMDQIVSLMVETMTDGIAELDQWATSSGLDLLSDEEVSDLRARIAEIQNYAERADDEAFKMGGTPQGKQVHALVARVRALSIDVLNALAENDASVSFADIDDARQMGFDVGSEDGAASLESMEASAGANIYGKDADNPLIIAAFVEGYREAVEKYKNWEYPPEGTDDVIVNAYESQVAMRDVDEWTINGYDGDDVNKIFTEVVKNTPVLEAGTTDVDATSEWMIKILPAKWHEWVQKNHEAARTQVLDKINNELEVDITKEMVKLWQDWETPKEVTKAIDKARQYDDEDAFRVIVEDVKDFPSALQGMHVEVTDDLIKTYPNIDADIIREQVKGYTLRDASDPDMAALEEAYDEARTHFGIRDFPPLGGYEEPEGLGMMGMFGPGSGAGRQLRGHNKPKPSWRTTDWKSLDTITGRYFGIVKATIISLERDANADISDNRREGIQKARNWIAKNHPEATLGPLKDALAELDREWPNVSRGFEQTPKEKRVAWKVTHELTPAQEAAFRVQAQTLNAGDLADEIADALFVNASIQDDEEEIQEAAFRVANTLSRRFIEDADEPVEPKGPDSKLIVSKHNPESVKVAIDMVYRKVRIKGETGMINLGIYTVGMLADQAWKIYDSGRFIKANGRDVTFKAKQQIIELIRKELVFAKEYGSAERLHIQDAGMPEEGDEFPQEIGTVIAQRGAPPHLVQPLMRITHVAWVPIVSGRLDSSIKYTDNPSYLGGMGSMVAMPWSKSVVLQAGTGDFVADFARWNESALDPVEEEEEEADRGRPEPGKPVAWEESAHAWLALEAQKAANTQREVHTKKHRSAKTFRYSPPDWHQDAMDALGRRDEETFKAIKLGQIGPAPLSAFRASVTEPEPEPEDFMERFTSGLRSLLTD